MTVRNVRNGGRSCYPSAPLRSMERLRGHPHELPGHINLLRKFEAFTEHWTPKVVAEMNDYQFKLVRIQGDFLWHDHPETDETSIVLEGRLRIEYPDGSVELGAGEMHVVPKGVRHKPSAACEAKLLVIEPRGVPNTGQEGGTRTAQNDVWI